MTVTPKSYTVELKDNYGERITYIENIVSDLSWEWLRIGGCGNCSIKLRTNFDSELANNLGEDYQISIYAPDQSGTSALWYSGYIDRIKPSVTGQGESIDVSVLGYMNQLKRCVVKDKMYNGWELSSLAREVVEVYGTGITSVLSAAANYEESNFIADQLYFNESVYNVIKKLADISGITEYGVKPDRNFYFIKRDDNINRYYNVSDNFVSYSASRDFNPIITKIFLEGGEGFNANFEVTNKLTTREEIVGNSSIISQSVAQQFARMHLKKTGRVSRSYTAQLSNKNTRLESTIPMGKAEINIRRGIRTKYDIVTNLYDSGIKYDGGTEPYQIEKVKYTLKDNDIVTDLTFNVLPPTIVDKFGELEYQLTNQSNMGA